MSQEKDRPPWPFPSFEDPAQACQSGEEKPYKRDDSLDIVEFGETRRVVSFADHSGWCAKNGDHLAQVLSVGPWHTARCANFEKYKDKKKPV